MSSVPPEKIAFDSTVLVNFGLTHATHLLAERFSVHAMLTAEVLREIESGIRTGRTHLAAILELVKFKAFSIQELNQAERTDFDRICPPLGPGEASCIALSSRRKFTVATDDRDARKECIRRGIPFIGTIGILQGLVVMRSLSLPAADTLLARMIEAGYWSPVASIRELFRRD